MIRPDQIPIPDEVVEAAGRAVYEAWCAVHGVADTSLPWPDIADEERDACIAEARAAIVATLSAWPRWKGCWDEDETGLHRCLLLPLPQKDADA